MFTHIHNNLLHNAHHFSLPQIVVYSKSGKYVHFYLTHILKLCVIHCIDILEKNEQVRGGLWFFDCSCLRVLCYVYFLLKLSHTYFQMQMPNEAPDPALGDGGYQGLPGMCSAGTDWWVLWHRFLSLILREKNCL